MDKLSFKKKLVALDYAKKVIYSYQIKDGLLEDDVLVTIFENRDKILKKNLCAFKSVEETENAFLVKISDRLTLEISKENGEIINKFYKLTNVEIKSISQGDLSKQERLPLTNTYINPDYIPTSDFHTHLETALSNKELMFLAIQDLSFENSKNFNEKFLNVNGIYCSDYDQDDFITNKSGKREIDRNILKEKYPEDYEKLSKSCDPIYYPLTLLEKVIDGKIDISKFDEDEIQKNKNGKPRAIKLSSLLIKDNENFKKLFKAMSLSLEEQETFSQLTDAIAVRQPIVDEKNFSKYLRLLAYEYRKNNVDYAELSTTSILNNNKENPGSINNRMIQINSTVPEIEKNFGVKLRFLASFDRNENNENGRTDEKIKMLKIIGKEPYVLGFDYMGFEKERNNEKVLRKLINYVIEENPEFIIRIHAGENKYPLENVDNALKIIKKSIEDKGFKNLKKIGCTKYLRESLKSFRKNGRMLTPKQKPENKSKIRYRIRYRHVLPQIRIGHAVFLNEYNDQRTKETIELLKELKAVVEINLSSNYALNNINSISTNPIKRYIDNGIPVVLCTDGHGMYSTNFIQELYLGALAGILEEDMKKIKITEMDLKDDGILNGSYVFTGLKEYVEDEEKVKYTQDDLNEKLRNFGVVRIDWPKEHIVKNEAFKSPNKKVGTKIPILITGASKSYWGEKLNGFEEDKEKIKELMRVLIDVLDEKNTFLVTGGTNFGVEKYAHLYNNDRKNKLNVLGVLTLESLKDFDAIEKDTMTHVMIVNKGNIPSNYWKEVFPGRSVAIVKELKGELIAISGGGVVEDIIQNGHNADLGCHLHLMAGIKGGSADKAKQLAGNGYEFYKPEELVCNIAINNPNAIDWNKLGIELPQDGVINDEILDMLANKIKLHVKQLSKKDNKDTVEVKQIEEVAETLTRSAFELTQTEIKKTSYNDKDKTEEIK